MVVQAYDGNLYCCVNDKDVYALEEVPFRAEKSKEFDMYAMPSKPLKRYIPPMDHPWRSKSFWKFVKAQEHHWYDLSDLPACQ